MSSFEPKNERKYFGIYALASKMGLMIKVMAHYHANIFVCFLVQMKTSKSHSEINWPSGSEAKCVDIWCT